MAPDKLKGYPVPLKNSGYRPKMFLRVGKEFIEYLHVLGTALYPKIFNVIFLSLSGVAAKSFSLLNDSNHTY